MLTPTKNPIRHGRVGLSPAAYDLWELISRERRKGECEQWFFSAPMTRLQRECGGVERPEVHNLIAELQAAGLVRFRCLTHDFVIVLQIVRPSWSGRMETV